MIRLFHSKFFTHCFAAVVSVCFAICSLQTQANDYYFDATSGSNANSGLDPQNPWKGFEMFDSTTLVAGDTLHFKRGEVWHSTSFILDVAGTAELPITLTAYGAGTTNPVFSGAAPLTSEDSMDFDIYDEDTEKFSGVGSSIGNIGNSIAPAEPIHALEGLSVRMEHKAENGSQQPRIWRSASKLAYAVDYKFTFWVKVDSNQLRVRVRNPGTCNYYDETTETWKYASVNSAVYDDSVPGWQEVTIEFTNDIASNATPTCSGNVDDRMLEINFYANGISYIDNLRLSAVWSEPQSNVYHRALLTEQNSAFLATIADPTQEGGSRLLNRKVLLSDLAANGDWFYDSAGDLGEVDEFGEPIEHGELMRLYWDGVDGALEAQDIEVGRNVWYIGNILGEHVNVEGITFEKGQTGLRVQASNVSVNNSGFRFIVNYSLLAQDSEVLNDLDSISITNSTFHTSGNGPYFVRVGNSTIANNDIHNITLAVQGAFTGTADTGSADVEGIPLYRTHDVIIEHNTVSNSRLGIDLWGNKSTGQSYTEESYNNTVRYNVISNMDKYGIVLGGNYSEEPVGNRGHVHGNVVHHNILIGNGLLHPNIGTGIFHYYTPLLAPNYYYNNTLYGNNTSFGSFYCTGGNFVFKNNISLQPVIRHLQLHGASWRTPAECSVWGDLASSVLSNNIYYPNEANAQTSDQLFNWHGTLDPSGNPYVVTDPNGNPQGYFANLADFSNATGQDATGSLGVDPTLASPLTNSFLTSSLSPTIDAGVDVGLTTDYAGNPILGLPDIGAYEFGHNDTDNDGLTDYQEICYDGDCQTNDPYDALTNPGGGDSNINNADTDGDGALDGAEVTAGFDPLNSNSTPSSIAAPLLNTLMLILYSVLLFIFGVHRLKRFA